MDILDIMKSRHSVRQYTDKKIEDEKRNILDAMPKAALTSRLFMTSRHVLIP